MRSPKKDDSGIFEFRLGMTRLKNWLTLIAIGVALGAGAGSPVFERILAPYLGTQTVSLPDGAMETIESLEDVPDTQREIIRSLARLQSDVQSNRDSVTQLKVELQALKPQVDALVRTYTAVYAIVVSERPAAKNSLPSPGEIQEMSNQEE